MQMRKITGAICEKISKKKKKPFLYSVALPGLMNFLRELSSMEALKRSIKSELLES